MDKYVIRKPQVSDLERLPSDVQGQHVNSQALRLFTVKGIVEDVTKYAYAHMRITYEPLQLKELHDKVCSLCPRAISAQEFTSSGSKHFHVFMELPLEYSASHFRKLRPIIQELWNHIDGVNYSISLQRYTEKLPSYVVKDGDFLQKGFSFNEMKTIQSQSYKKYSQADYAKALVSIRQEYLHDIINQHKAIQNILDTRAKMKINGCSDTSYVVKKLKDWNCQKFQSVRDSLTHRVIRELDQWELDDMFR